jgi:hypothetical protein
VGDLQARARIADLGEHVDVRNSNHPDAGTLTFTRTALAAFIHSCKAGQLDHLAR